VRAGELVEQLKLDASVGTPKTSNVTNPLTTVLPVAAETTFIKNDGAVTLVVSVKTNVAPPLVDVGATTGAFEVVIMKSDACPVAAPPEYMHIIVHCAFIPTRCGDPYTHESIEYSVGIGDRQAIPRYPVAQLAHMGDPLTDHVPSEQDKHRELDVAPDTVENVPAIHGLHWLLREAPTELNQVPALHNEHVAAETGDQVPASHVRQVAEVTEPEIFELVPAAQPAQEKEPMLDQEPAAQSKHDDDDVADK
jgi:hypothetical protein